MFSHFFFFGHLSAHTKTLIAIKPQQLVSTEFSGDSQNIFASLAFLICIASGHNNIILSAACLLFMNSYIKCDPIFYCILFLLLANVS